MKRSISLSSALLMKLRLTGEGYLSSTSRISARYCTRVRTLLPLIAVAGSKVGLRNCLVGRMAAVLDRGAISCDWRKFFGAVALLDALLVGRLWVDPRNVAFPVVWDPGW